MLSLLGNVIVGDDVCLEVKLKPSSLTTYHGMKALHDRVLPHIQDLSASSLKMWVPEPQPRRRTGVKRKVSGDLDD